VEVQVLGELKSAVKGVRFGPFLFVYLSLNLLSKVSVLVRFCLFTLDFLLHGNCSLLVTRF
jgi:hypothetical protein